jgi:DNA polymerase
MRADDGRGDERRFAGFCEGLIISRKLGERGAAALSSFLVHSIVPDARTMPVVYVDIESRSKVSLKDRGSWRYCADSSTELLFLCWAVDDGEVQTWRQGDPVPAPFLAAAHAPVDWTVVVHNWEFERPFCELILTPRFGIPVIPLERWHCSMRLALANAHPAELGLLSQALGLPYRKDPKGVKALREVSRPRKKGGGWDEDPDKLALVHARCVLDVITTRAVWTHPKLRRLSESERRLQLLDAEINRRGVRIDRAFVEAARTLAANERNAINVRISELTEGEITSVNQVQRLRAAVNARGHAMATLGKRSVATVLAHDPDDHVRELLELRRDGARASVRKFTRILDFAADDRLRGTLRMYGATTGRWTSPGPQLHNLRRNELGLPLSVVDAVRAGDRAHLMQFGSLLNMLGSVSRAAICAADGYLLFSGDFRMIESRTLAWAAGDERKLAMHRDYDRTGDKNLEPYRVIAAQMINKPVVEIVDNERQQGKFAELAAGFGGGVGAWRRIFDDPRSDAEIERDKVKWRQMHPRIVRFWQRLFKAVRIAVKHQTAVRVNEPPLPSIVASFEDGDLFIALPSGRSLTYPTARLVPGKFEGTVDLAFFDNSKKQWREVHEWYGTLVENVVSGIARDLLAEAIMRFEARGLPVVFHWHDDVVCEVPEGAISEAEFLAILLEPPPWAEGLPLAGSVHSGTHYLPAPDKPAVPSPLTTKETAVPAESPAPAVDPVEQAIDALVAEPGEVDYTPTELRTFEREDTADELANLEEYAAPLYEIAMLAAPGGGKIICPFHADSDPSCQLFADHFHCYGCGAHGNRIDWLTEAEGMTKAEAVRLILEWDSERKEPVDEQKTTNTKRALALWKGAKSIAGTLAERYLAETRKIAVDKLPPEINDSLRFYDQCPYGKGIKHPCLLALMTDPAGTACGVHRIALVELNGKVDRIGRMALGSMGLVRLWPAVNGRLVIGEGVETTCAAASRIHYRGAPLTPAWSAVSDLGIKQLPVIEGVRELLLLVDHDRNGAGQDAAMVCERRWRQAGREVVQLMPNEPGWDFNDVIMRRSP